MKTTLSHSFCLLSLALVWNLVGVLTSLGATVVTFTNETFIADTSYDGQDIVVSGCTVTVDGSHSFNSLQLTNGGVLTHPATTASQEHSLKLSIAGDLVVGTNSAIDVSGKGYLPGYTLGNTTLGASVGYAGGSYGGLGGVGAGSANGVYGDYRNPNELGSGGSDAPGGGLLRITVGAATIDGAIRANGAGNGASGGSGGGIFLSAGTLAGAGSISANGGVAWGNGAPASGGGGRIAVNYGVNNGFDVVNNVMAIGAAHGAAGAVGTVYLHQSRRRRGPANQQPRRHDRRLDAAGDEQRNELCGGPAGDLRYERGGGATAPDAAAGKQRDDSERRCPDPPASNDQPGVFPATGHREQPGGGRVLGD